VLLRFVLTLIVFYLFRAHTTLAWQVEEDYDLHDPQQKRFMRNQASAQHVKNMQVLVTMVEHTTVQKCELPWPGLFNPTEDQIAEAAADKAIQIAAAEKAATRQAAKKTAKAPEPAAKTRGRKKGQKVNKPAPPPSVRETRKAATAKAKREKDAQPLVSMLPKPAAPATDQAEHQAAQQDTFDSPIPNGTFFKQSPGCSSSTASGNLSSASTHWLDEFKKERETSEKKMQEVYDAEVAKLTTQMEALRANEKVASASAAHYKALYDDAKSARDEWKAMVLQLLPAPASR
jgi:hypothetical protein